MKRQYIDFVPAKNRLVKREISQPVVRAVQVTYVENVVKEIPKEPETPAEKVPNVQTKVTPETTIEEFLKDQKKLASEDYFDAQPSAEYGIIEDYTPLDKKKSLAPATFKPANVEKRPLSTPHHFTSSKAMRDVASAKSEKILKKPLDLSKKPTEHPTAKNKEVESFKTPFVNHNVEKRPLSKTVYPKKEQKAVQEESSAPVTIIDKPEKDSRISFVIAVLLTIILGAVIGTVAFLLLPR